jgi:hypothetical protein
VLAQEIKGGQTTESALVRGDAAVAEYLGGVSRYFGVAEKGYYDSGLPEKLVALLKVRAEEQRNRPTPQAQLKWAQVATFVQRVTEVRRPVSGGGSTRFLPPLGRAAGCDSARGIFGAPDKTESAENSQSLVYEFDLKPRRRLAVECWIFGGGTATANRHPITEISIDDAERVTTISASQTQVKSKIEMISR